MTLIAQGIGCQVIATAAELAEQVRGLLTKKCDVIVMRTPTRVRPQFLTVVVVPLGVEWILRRRAGYR